MDLRPVSKLDSERTIGELAQNQHCWAKSGCTKPLLKSTYLIRMSQMVARFFSPSHQSF